MNRVGRVGLIVVLLFLASCKPVKTAMTGVEGEAPAIQPASHDLQKFYDADEKVMCYRFRGREGISCVKL